MTALQPRVVPCTRVWLAQAWRQSVRDDEWYSNLLRTSYPEVLSLILSGTDDEVQNMLRAQHSAQAASQAQRQEL